MKHAFNYHGKDADGNHHVSIISDDEKREEKLVGIDISYIHYIFDPKWRSAERVDHMLIGQCRKNYCTVPRPTQREAIEAWDRASRFFHPLLPLWGIPIIIGHGTYFFRSGGWAEWERKPTICIEPTAEEVEQVYELAWKHYTLSCAASNEAPYGPISNYRNHVPIHEAVKIVEFSTFLTNDEKKWQPK